ncbi:OB-fold domain-containing protein [Nocardia sp. NPDC019395]|uniref:Zn-ribbon domain-containing OB-fold protein n=1 Tax=Nocardia sp. NPDC019395 TaxID=3154686 RepID=UPI00340E69AB
MTERPLPVPDEVSGSYWTHANRHVLALARCLRCRRFAIPPGLTCPHCHTVEPAYEFEPVSGRGTVRSWTVVRRASLLGFAGEVPYLLVDVELAAQAELRMIGRLLDGPDAVVRAGDPVEVAFEDVTAEVSVPAFVLAGRS